MKKKGKNNRRRLIFVAVFSAGLLSAVWFMASLLYYITARRGIGVWSAWDTELLKLLPLFSAIVSAIGTLSSVTLAWKVSQRDVKERDLRIERLERDLEIAKQTTKDE
jgi:hypothetical protein